MMKSHAQKNTLLKNADATATSNFFKRVFFSPTQEEFFPPLFFLFFFRHRTGAVHNRTVGASNVNRFMDKFLLNSDGHDHWTDSKPAGNMGLNEMAGKVVNQTVVLSTKCWAWLTVRASNPPLR